MPQIPYINIHKHRSPSKGELAIQSVFAHDIPSIPEDLEGIYSIGIHPWHAEDKEIGEQISLMEQYTKHKNVVAIGEIGLDRLTPASMELQKKILISQLEIANKVKKPVIIHCVKTHPDIISTFKDVNFKGKVIFHGFNQNRQIAGQLLKNGFYLSFGQALLNEKSNATKLFSVIPDNSFFLETDEAEVDIKIIYKRAAQIKNTTAEDIIKSVSDNFTRCFNLRF